MGCGGSGRRDAEWKEIGREISLNRAWQNPSAAVAWENARCSIRGCRILKSLNEKPQAKWDNPDYLVLLSS